MFKCGWRFTSGGRVLGPFSQLTVAVLVGLGVHLAGHWTNAADKAPVKPATVAPTGGPNKPSASVKPEKAVQRRLTPLPKPPSDEEMISALERKLAEIEKQSGTTPAKQPSKALSAEELYAKASPAVVTISVENEDGQKIGSGSGFFAADAVLPKVLTREDRRLVYVLTSQHILRGAVKAQVTLPGGGMEEVAEVLAESERVDVALLSVIVPAGRNLPALALADIMPAVGATVYTIGSPGGDLTNSLSVGIVSGLRKRSSGVTWLQTTAPISPGSSGGPLLASDGRVVGIATASRVDGQNLNFAVPVSEAKRCLKPPYRPREVWRGRSMREAERWAYLNLVGSVGSREQIKARSEELRRDPAFLLTWADMCIRGGHYERAVDRSSSALKSISDQWRYLAYYTLGKAYSGLASTSARKRLSEEATVKQATDTDGDKAIAALEMAAKENPNFAPTFMALNGVHFDRDEYPESLLAANRVVALLPYYYGGYLVRGMSFLKLKRDESALRDLKMAVDLNPVNIGTHWCLGSVHHCVGNYEDAVESFQTAIRLGDGAKSYWGLGFAYKQMGKYDKAIAAFEKGRVQKDCDDLDSFDRQIAQCKAKSQ